MNIVLTNDDGVASPMLRFLSDALRTLNFSCWIVAPESNRSGQAHSITITQGVTVKRVDEYIYSCSGTPADCINYAVKTLLKDQKIDLIISGVNLGYNLGSDLIYSGTAAGARQGSFLGIPSVSVSWGLKDERALLHADLNSLTEEKIDEFFPNASWLISCICENLPNLIKLIEPNSFLNINFPEKKLKTTQWRAAILGIRQFDTEITCFDTPHGTQLCYIYGHVDEEIRQKGADTEIVFQGDISYSLVENRPRLKKDLEELQEVEATLTS